MTRGKSRGMAMLEKIQGRIVSLSKDQNQIRATPNTLSLIIKSSGQQFGLDEIFRGFRTRQFTVTCRSLTGRCLFIPAPMFIRGVTKFKQEQVVYDEFARLTQLYDARLR